MLILPQAKDADADEDAVLGSELTALMAETGADFTNTFRWDAVGWGGLR